MVPSPARPAAEQEEPAGATPAEPGPAAFPDLDEYVDLVSELEEILRASGESPVRDASDSVPAPEVADDEPEQEPAAPSPAPLRVRARAEAHRPHPEAAPVPDSAGAVDPGFWQVDESSWTNAPAWRETRRARGLDLFIIGALVVLIAGGGAYSALRFGDASGAGGDGVAAEPSRAEAGLGVPFAPVGRTGLLRDDPTAAIPSLEAAVAGADVAPLPVIIEAPVEAMQPVFLAEADPAAVPPAAADPGPAAPATAIGGPLVPPEAADAEGGVRAGIVTTVTTWVNMRAGPDNGEPVVMVVSPETPVSVGACDYWCTVTVDGRTGYIFRDFLVDLP